MKCPMTFSDPCTDRDDECRGAECMWYVREVSDMSGDKVISEGCAIAMIPRLPYKWINAQKNEEE